MSALFSRLAQIGLLSLLSLSTSLSPTSLADSGPAAPALSTTIQKTTWGTLDPLTRLLPIDSYTGSVGGALSLAGARNEVVDGQLLLFAAAEPWNGVQLSFSDLTGPHGASLPAASLRWRRVGMIRTQQPTSYRTRYVGLWPDPLLPAAPLDVAPQGRAGVWVDMHIPYGTQAGRYTGTITLRSKTGTPRTVPLVLRVYGFTLPRQNHILTAFGAGFNGKHQIDTQAVIDDLLAHRITPDNAPGRPRVVVPPSPGHPGQWDWTDWDRRMEGRLAQGMTCFAVDSPKLDPDWGRAYQDHLEQKGWLQYAYVYAADEPSGDQLPALNDRIAAFKRAAPRLTILVTARGYPSALTHVDIWCPCMIAERNDYFLPANARREQERGRSSWWYPAYPSHSPTINVWTDYPVLDDRIWAWLSWKHNVDGMLYWTVANWKDIDAPLQDARSFLDANGDGVLLYPDAQGRPIDSIRLEAIRDGLQDYEVFCLLEAGARELSARHASPDLVKQAEALTAIDDTLVSSFRRFNPDPQALLATRTRMSVTLERIVTALGHDPEIVGRPHYRSAQP